MEDEPTNAEPPKRKRRWFQFSLRTLLIAVALLAVPCAYVGWEAKIVKDRDEFLENQQHYMGPNPFDEENGDPSVPWILRILGAKPVYMIIVYSPADAERAKALFPETKVISGPVQNNLFR